MQENLVALKSVFTSLPGNNILVLPDKPVFTIVAVSDDYLKATDRAMEALLGKGLFDAFPNNPADAEKISEKTVRASLEYAIHYKEAHHLPVQRYDVADSDGLFKERYWSASNKPVLHEDGEVAYVVHSIVDVTEKIQEDRRKEKIENLQKAYNLFMNAPVIIGVLKGDDYTIDLANEGLLEVWGRKSDVLGKPLLEAIPELKEQGFIALLDEVRKTGQPFYAYEMPIKLVRMGKEEVIYFDFVYKPFYDDENEGKAPGIISVGYNVTEQVMLRQKFKNVVQQAADPILILKGEDMVLEVANEALLQLWKVDETAIGKTFLEILPEMKGQGFLELLQQVYHTGETFHGYEAPAVFNEKNGDTRTVYFNFTYQPYREADGSITGVLVLATDVTGQVLANKKMVESERNLRNMILQAPVAMCIIRGADYVVEIANEHMLAIWGKTTGQVIGKPVFDANPEGRGQGIEEILETIYRTGQPSRIAEIPLTLLRHGKLEQLYVNLSYDPIKEGDGTVSGVLVVGIEVTEQVLARQKIEDIVAQRTQELQKSNEALTLANLELTRSNTNLEEFAHAASHDMKEPIRKVLTFADRLKMTLNDRMTEKEKQLFERMENSTQRMRLLVDDLLEFSHVSERPLEKETVDLNTKLKSVLSDLELQIDEYKAAITIGHLPVVKGYKRQLQQLFQNLVSNALKYSHPGVPPQICITAKKVTGKDVARRVLPEQVAQPFYLIEVSDKGIGFDQQFADKIFGMFQRLHSKAEYAGTGVGLSIARKVVENHLGYIWAESQKGVGSTFKILLPAD